MRFSNEDSGQTGDVTGELRVVFRSRSCSLSYVPELIDQIAASWKEFAHEGGCSRGKMSKIFSAFFLFLLVFARAVDVAHDVEF